MQPSPLQLKEYNFLIVSIKAREEFLALEDRPFPMDGITIKEQIQWGIAGDNHENPIAFGLKLNISIDNDVPVKCPYDIEVEAQALFTVDESFPLEKRESLVLVNGCSILYSVIRELILTITSRGALGPIMMPTVNFIDHQDTPINIKAKN